MKEPATLESLGFWTMCAGFIWTIADFLGQVGVGSASTGLMKDGLCFSYVGCNSGFFGYDAFVHFCAGVAGTLFFVWLCRTYPSIDILPATRRGRLLVIFASVMLCGFFWELLEFSGDLISVHILHLSVLHPNNLSQPTNADTMGDMSFNGLGSLVALLFLWCISAL